MVLTCNGWPPCSPRLRPAKQWRIHSIGGKGEMGKGSARRFSILTAAPKHWRLPGSVRDTRRHLSTLRPFEDWLPTPVDRVELNTYIVELQERAGHSWQKFNSFTVYKRCFTFVSINYLLVTTGSSFGRVFSSRRSTSTEVQK